MDYFFHEQPNFRIIDRDRKFVFQTAMHRDCYLPKILPYWKKQPAMLQYQSAILFTRYW